MKESENFNKDEIQNVRQVEAKKQQILVIQKKNVPKNHTWFEYERKTGKITTAVFEDLPVTMESAQKRGKDAGARKKLLTKPNCMYDHALNVENFKKKVNAQIKKESFTIKPKNDEGN